MNLEVEIDETEGTVPDLRAEGRRIGTVPGGQATIDKGRVKRAFSRQAPIYEENASLQRDVANRLITLVCSRLRTPNSRLRTLDIGIGTGFATKEFSGRFPRAHIFGCDIARGMLTEARETGASLTEADVEHLPYRDNSFDLIFSSLALQWTDLSLSLAEAFRVMRSGGSLYFTTFGDRTLAELANSYCCAWRSNGTRGMPKGMKFEPPQEVENLMESAGFRDVRIGADLLNTRFPSPEALLRSLKAIGAGNPTGTIPSKRLLNEIFRVYEERYGDSGGISATFEVVYARGVKG